MDYRDGDHYTAVQGGIWLVGRRSICGCRLSLRPIICTSAVCDMNSAAAVAYAACDAIQVLYALPSVLLFNVRMCICACIHCTAFAVYCFCVMFYFISTLVVFIPKF